MVNSFKEHIKSDFPELADDTFLLACSGGVDSVVLTHLCKQSGLDFALAHCNFRLRGKESDEDEEFVKGLAGKLDLKLHITHFDTIGYVNKNKVSVQMAARDLRYHWFAELMQEKGYKKLLTAHHADDNLETFLINLSRGTGLNGLTGIPEKTVNIARPLLKFSRGNILTYAKNQNLDWRDDKSNEDTKYLRNKIRKDVVPKLKKLNPAFLDNFGDTLEHLSGSAAILENYIQDLKGALFVERRGVVWIDIARLGLLTPLQPHLYALFNEYGFTQWDDIEDLLTALSGKEVRSRTQRLIKDRTDLLLKPIEEAGSKSYSLIIEDRQMEIPVRMSISHVNSMDEQSKDILYVDKETLNHQLTVRKWEKGDYFYPLGMEGKKKVSKFFKDEKTDKVSKERQWLLCSGDKIVWIIGRRADDRFKVTSKTKNILKFSLQE